MSEEFIGTFLIVFVLTIFGIVGAIFVFAIKHSQKRLDIEQGSEPILEIKCGGHLGWYRYTFPFVRFAIYPHFLTISAMFRQFLIYYDDIIEIKPKIFGGFKIIHKREDLPRSIIIYTAPGDDEPLNVLSEISGKAIER